MAFKLLEWLKGGKKAQPAGGVAANAGEETPNQRMARLIKKGVLIEDEFITTYVKILNEQAFLELFGSEKKEAALLMQRMLDDSREHKATLENILAKSK